MIRLLNMNYTRCNMGRYVRGRSCLNMMSVILNLLMMEVYTCMLEHTEKRDHFNVTLVIRL